MNEPMSEKRLVALLEAMAGRAEFPPTPGIAARVVEALEGAPRRSRRKPFLARRRLALALALAVGVVAALSLSAPVRRAVADLLEVVGIHIEFEEVDTTGLPGPDLSEVGLGRAVTASEARDLASFPLRGPLAADGSGSYYFDASVGSSGMFSTVFGTPEDLRLVTEFEARVDADVLKKLAPRNGSVQPVVVGSAEGYWLTGDVHVFGYLDSSGEFRQETVRLAGNVLIWDRAGVTYRVEGPRSLSEALTIAARMGF